MDAEEILGRSPGDPLTALIRQDLDPFSVEELAARIALLEGEIARVRARMAFASQHRASADALFKR
ncbi:MULTISPECIES: DUF1192 domain-containing protein [unclassified Sphingomonas]|jgi:uncharacterized small protein (DUF1192 family)|uniref:DUF1192 domain-containing protein n=1 Tax=unclassified Sphingomonas TaxID=196159 RepID=UPI00082B4812|nr:MULTISPECIES: DUF1192 domain-containing protein [unclassified Sphingomonas]MCH4894220.1 DUF1192 family protein [Sphingomonas sp. SFZ2018-12]